MTPKQQGMFKAIVRDVERAAEGRERARVVALAVDDAGANVAQLARALGYTRSRVYQLRDEGRVLFAEEGR